MTEEADCAMEDTVTEQETTSETNGDTNIIAPQEMELEVETCRLCDELSEKMYNIFEENPEGYQLITLIKENLPIVLYKADPLSKQVCEKCVEQLQIVNGLKKRSRNTQEKYVDKLKSEGDTKDQNVLLFLGCTGSKIPGAGDNEDEEDEEEELKDVGTSTEDLTILCVNCKTAIVDASTVNGDVELDLDLHKIIADSLKKNRVITADSESEKVLRKRKIQPIYQELDDSLCSSLTDLTRQTPGDEEDETSQYPSEIESEESGDERPVKRRKLDSESQKIQEEIDEEVAKHKEEPEEPVEPVEPVEPEKIIDYVEMFEQEPDITFEPLSLLQIALNSFNKHNIPDLEVEHCLILSTACKCKVCDQDFKNMKLLALHETEHMEVDMDEKIDNPLPWPEDHTFADVRNKWLTYFDEHGYEEDDIVLDICNGAREEVSLLVEKSAKTVDMSKKDEVVLVNMKPMVNGIYLGDYTKEERKAFYQCMRIGGQTKRFCPLCRYCFKDNWAIESHYFSSACHYTCRYCGMRFNKQRHRFDEHLDKHKEKNDPISEKIFTASKVSTAIPKVIQLNKVKMIFAAGEPEQPREIKLEDYQAPLMQKRFEQKSRFGPGPQVGLGPHGYVKIKEEPKDFTGNNPTNKSQNQAYFCRKCYKVFFKLDEFNAHSKSCDYNQFTPTFPRQQASPNPVPRNTQNHVQRNPPHVERRPNGGGEYTSAGRPIRNCVKDIGPYTDEVYIPKQLLNETVSSNPAQGFICHICGTPFPTIYSRNSHMRIHKGEPMVGGPQMMMPQPQQQNNILKQRLQQQHHAQRPNFNQQRSMYQAPKQQNNYPQFEEVKIKQEPVDSFEPMVEIHEGHEEPPSPPQRYNNAAPPRELGGGAVSITPINKTNNQRQSLNPNIVKLMQNNPNISISKRSHEKPPQQQRHSTGSTYVRTPGNFNGNSGYQGPYAPTQNNYQPANMTPVNQDDRSYKCSSCWEAFSNKSHLYFHKKNQCEGSRFPCPFCKKRFGTEAAYSSHIFYSHPE